MNPSPQQFQAMSQLNADLYTQVTTLQQQCLELQQSVTERDEKIEELSKTD